jgi:hypothetical protein
LRHYVAGANGNSNPLSLKHALRTRLRRTGSDE